MKPAQVGLARQQLERQVGAGVALDEPYGTHDAALGVGGVAWRALRLGREAHGGGSETDAELAPVAASRSRPGGGELRDERSHLSYRRHANRAEARLAAH